MKTHCIQALIFLSLIGYQNLHSYQKQFFLQGELVDVNTSQGKSYFSIQSTENGKIHHILCPSQSIQELIRAFQSNQKSREPQFLRIHAKAKIIKIGSPLLMCTSQPILRIQSSSSSFLPSTHSSSSHRTSPTATNRNSWGQKYVAGQVLSADPESGLLTIQTGKRKVYLKIDPQKAEKIHKKISQMGIHNIDDTFHYDRDRGYFVGKKESLP